MDDIEIERLAELYLNQSPYVSFKMRDTPQYVLLKETFIVAYKRGYGNYLQNRIKWIEDCEDDICKERVIAARQTAMARKEIREAEKEQKKIERLKNMLKENFKIYDVTHVHISYSQEQEEIIDPSPYGVDSIDLSELQKTREIL